MRWRGSWRNPRQPRNSTPPPGNPGIAEEAELVALDVTDHAAVIGFCADKSIGLVVIGPEAPLVDGLSDSLRAAGGAGVRPLAGRGANWKGPRASPKGTCAPAQGSPPAGYVRTASLDDAPVAALTRFDPPYVLKADGLGGGQGAW